MPDEDQLYNRQEYAVGKETQVKYGQTSVLLVGLSGVGCEIAKNLALTGVKSITLLDTAPIAWSDLSSLFFATEADVGAPRAATILPKLSELNRFVSISLAPETVAKEGLSEDFIKKFTAVIFVDFPTTRLARENLWARRNGVKFVACESRGVAGAIFVDAGDSFDVLDANGEETVSCIVTGIAKDGIVACHEDKKHECEVGSFVYFTGVTAPQAMNSVPKPSGEGTGLRLFKVLDIVGPFIVKIELPPDILSSSGGIFVPGSGAYMHTTKKKEVMHFKCLEESVKNPEFNMIIDDDAKLSAPYDLHTIFQVVHEFMESSSGRAPPSTSHEVELLVSKLAARVDNKRLVRDIVSTFRGNLNPMACIVGGLASQEVLKCCSGKFTPVAQWWYFDAREVLDSIGELSFDERQPPGGKGSRYDGTIHVLGRALTSALTEQRVFIVGAGALGCELIKNVACLGVKHVTITDMDTIEMSNLSRQFLFRSHHIGQAKAAVAGRAAAGINAAMTVTALLEKVAQDTAHVFDAKFWAGHDLAVNALDNVIARKYVDSQCLFYQRPLFESGTLGTKCNVQVVIPHVTESYSSSYDPPEQSIPLCTLKNFPNAIEHTIQWARDAFHELSSGTPTDVNAYLDDPEAFAQSLDRDPGQKPIVLRNLLDILSNFPTTPEDCVRRARVKFEEMFNHFIKQLLHNIPIDKLNENGTPFWSGAKKPPTPAEFGKDAELHYDFIFHTAALLAEAYGVEGLDRLAPEYIMSVAAGTPVAPFVPRVVTFALSETEKKDNSAAQLAGADLAVSDLPAPTRFAGRRAKPIVFEKDHDGNHHIDFITATSNIRATSYQIPNADKFKTKMIAGNIIPAMVTTTSLVTGFVGLEMIKYVAGEKRLVKYRNAFINIALPMFSFSDPISCGGKTYKKPDGTTITWTIWDKLLVDEGRSLTVKDLVAVTEARYSLTINMITLTSGKTIYMPFGGKKDLGRLVEDVARDRGMEITDNVGTLSLVVCADMADQEVDVPILSYKFR
jgi:ubiquitin-activating enzyme E1